MEDFCRYLSIYFLTKTMMLSASNSIMLTLMFIFLWFLFYYHERQEISSLFIFICSSSGLSYVQISTSFIWPPLTSENILVNYFYCNVAVKSDQWPVSRVLFTRHVGAGSWYWHTFIKVRTSQNKLKILTTHNVLPTT